MSLLQVAYVCGTVATVCAVAQYVPQLLLNYRRHSTVGLSASSIVLKLAGASVLLFNALFLGEAAPVVLYGLGNIATHTLFMVQFHIYAPQPAAPPAAPKTLRAHATALVAHYRYLLWTLFPLVPLVVDTLFPAIIPYTSCVKPVTQLVSHLPQLGECVRLRSTQGISYASQALNLVGGVAGLVMCAIVPPKTGWTWLLYGNSIFQALSLYALACLYDPHFLAFVRSSPSATSAAPTHTRPERAV